MAKRAVSNDLRKRRASPILETISRHTQMKIGLTGGMGGGKSTAAGFFEEAGFRRIDSDRIVRDELLVNPRVVAEIASRFPDAVNDRNEVVRPVLASHVFSNDEHRIWLESMLHPMVYARWRELFAGAPDETKWVVEVPLLFEQGLENWFDFTVCVSTSSATQIARLIERGIPQSLAGQRISKQLPLALKVEKADFVLSNDGTLESLRMQVNHLASRLSAGC